MGLGRRNDRAGFGLGEGLGVDVADGSGDGVTMAMDADGVEDEPGGTVQAATNRATKRARTDLERRKEPIRVSRAQSERGDDIVA